MSEQDKVVEVVIPDEAAGRRLDKVLPSLLYPYSRSQLQQWLRDGRVTMGGLVPSQRQPVVGGEQIRLVIPEQKSEDWEPQQLPLQVIYEDADIVVVDKPAGLVVHPGAGNPDTTLANAILHRYPETQVLPRAGVVHRLDKGTTGLLVVARTQAARQQLVRDIEMRTVERTYLALVNGAPIAGETIDAPIGRHPRDRRRMTVAAKGKSAITHFRLEQRFGSYTLLRVRLETGRTHQIRVHLAHIGFPLVGDRLYGGRLRVPAGASGQLLTMLRDFNRQALHASVLAITHPTKNTRCSWESSLPEDFKKLLGLLVNDGVYL